MTEKKIAKTEAPAQTTGSGSPEMKARTGQPRIQKPKRDIARPTGQPSNSEQIYITKLGFFEIET